MKVNHEMRFIAAKEIRNNLTHQPLDCSKEQNDVEKNIDSINLVLKRQVAVFISVITNDNNNYIRYSICNHSLIYEITI